MTQRSTHVETRWRGWTIRIILIETFPTRDDDDPAAVGPHNNDCVCRACCAAAVRAVAGGAR